MNLLGLLLLPLYAHALVPIFSFVAMLFVAISFLLSRIVRRLVAEQVRRCLSNLADARKQLRDSIQSLHGTEPTQRGRGC